MMALRQIEPFYLHFGCRRTALSGVFPTRRVARDCCVFCCLVRRLSVVGRSFHGKRTMMRELIVSVERGLIRLH